MPGREVFLGRVSHPDPMTSPLGDVMVLIDDPVADRLVKGDPTLGWEGDDRLALYLNHGLHRWELWRLEADNQYRCVMCVPGHIRGLDAVGRLVMRLVEIDSRRGHDTLQVVESSHNRWLADKAKQEAEFESEWADRLVFALDKDGAL